ncbi:MAG: DUF2877 domain-containing protein [Deltaproteobacteria bacterium]|nr:DUF2877 domain-containing protein [Deltaproteobacteria bacterium]
MAASTPTSLCERFDGAWLCRSRPWTGHVAHCYRQAWVALPDDPEESWLTLLHSDRALTPASLVLEGGLAPEQGLALRLDGRDLLFGDGRLMRLEGDGRSLMVSNHRLPVSKKALRSQLALGDWPERSRALAPCRPATRHKRHYRDDCDTRKLDSFVKNAPTQVPLVQGGLGDTLSDELATRFAALLAELGAGLPLLHMKRLAGLGPGSTPSGDDMLVGVSAALRRLVDVGWRDHEQLRIWNAALLALPERTSTPTAMQMLREAASGRFVDPLARAASWLACEARADELTEQIRLLGALGAQSGEDMLAGLLGLAQGDCR